MLGSRHVRTYVCMVCACSVQYPSTVDMAEVRDVPAGVRACGRTGVRTVCVHKLHCSCLPLSTAGTY